METELLFFSYRQISCPTITTVFTSVLGSMGHADYSSVIFHSITVRSRKQDNSLRENTRRVTHGTILREG